MIIKDALVFTPDKAFVKKDIVIRDGFFADEGSLRLPDEEVIDAKGCYAIPGLLDIHFHGALGFDVGDATKEAFEKISEYEASVGVTAICPATMTLPVDELEHILAVGAEFAGCEHRGADLLGFNMEGPFISHPKKGSQNEKYIIPADSSVVDRFVSASKGLVRIIGLAPEETPGFEDFIRDNREKTTISLAHTNADYETAKRAFDAGASHAVHLYNAMTGLSHREPGVIGAVSDSHHVNAEIICDGIHVHPAVVRAAFKLMGPDRMVLVSDTLRCAGSPDGEYDLAGQTVVKKGKYCTLKDKGNLAGSVTNLFDCMRIAVKEMDIPLDDAIACATINPARAIHVDDRYGSIEKGKIGDVVLLSNDENLSLKMVIKKGVVY